MNPKTGVLQIIDRSTLGGGQRVLLWLAQGLAADPSFDVRIACAAGGAMWLPFEQAASSVHDIPLRRLPSPRSLVRLHRLIRQRRVRVVHTHGGIAGLWGRLVAISAGVPVIVHTLHGIHYLHHRNPIARATGIALERLLGRFTECTIYVSISDLEEARAHRLSRPAHAALVLNAVPAPLPAERAPSRADAFGVPGDRFVILCIARMDPVKGHPVLFEAFRSISIDHPAAHLVLIGGGPFEARYRRAIERLGLDDRVTFLGTVPDAEQLLPAADLVVIPSLWEAFSLAALEAMAAARPIVASRAGGLVHLLEDRVSGLLVEPGDPRALAAAIDEMIQSPELRERLASAAGAAFHRSHRLETMVAEVRAIYAGGLARAGLL